VCLIIRKKGVECERYLVMIYIECKVRQDTR